VSENLEKVQDKVEFHVFVLKEDERVRECVNGERLEGPFQGIHNRAQGLQGNTVQTSWVQKWSDHRKESFGEWLDLDANQPDNRVDSVQYRIAGNVRFSP
jgi:hypothetical protein